MILSERFDGSNTPFEGDTIFTVRSLPEGAVVNKAVLRLSPQSRSGVAPFEETIQFSGERGDWGATQVIGMIHGNPMVEVDFHNRRTLVRVDGANLVGSNLLVDMGGLYVQINQDGAMKVPDEGTLFTLPNNRSFPGLTVSKFMLTNPGFSMSISRIVVRSVPSNITARLGSLPPFWARPGELTRDETSPDFTPILRAFLQETRPENGFYQIPLTLHSDTIARLNATLEIDYVVQQPALPGGLQESTLPYDYNSVPLAGSASIQVSLPPGAQVLPEQTRARVRGAFQETRVGYGPTGAVSPVGAANLTPSALQAQAIMLENDLAATSLDLLLSTVSRTASLSINIMEDVDGKVWNQPLLSRPVTLTLDRDLASSATWINMALPAEFQFRSGERYWLVIQCISGEATWSVKNATAGAAGMQSSTDGGLSWRTSSLPGVSGQVEAYFRLRNTPPKFTMPLDVEIGEGDGAIRLDMKRYEPLGRVEFNLDSNDMAAAFNQYLAQSAAGGICPQGEHIENGEFAAWWRTSDDPSTPEPFRLGHPALRVAVSKDGCRAFVATIDPTPVVTVAASGQPIFLERIDVFSDRTAGSGQIGSGIPLGLDVHPDGSRAYALLEVASGYALVVYEPEASTPTLPLLLADMTASSLVISPDGNSLYLAAYFSGGEGEESGRVYRCNPQALVAALRAGQTDAQALLEVFMDLGEEHNPGAIALTPDGKQLLVGVTRNDLGGRGELVILDIARGTEVGSALAIAPETVDIAVSSAGTHALVVSSSSTTVLYVNLFSRLVDLIELPTNSEPAAAAFMPEGDRAYVTLREVGEIVRVDLTGTEPLERIAVGTMPSDIAITPGGERIYVADQIEGADPAMSLIRVGMLLPQEWTLTAGRVMPYCFPPPYGRLALLGDIDSRQSSMTAGLSQVVPVSGGCRYEFSFWGIATEQDAFAEVLWLGNDCRQAGQEQVPITPLQLKVEDRTRLSSSSRRAPEPRGDEPELVFHRAVFDIPAGVIQAEVRFRTPAGVAAGFDQVSLKATVETLTNGDLQQLVQGGLAGWTVIPENPAGVSLLSDGATISIVNSGNAAITLSQSAAFSAETAYLLELSGYSQATAGRGAPGVKLTWLDSANNPIGVPALLEIRADGSQHHALSGVSPGGAAQIELALTVPPGATLSIQRVSMQPKQEVVIPVTFIAQAPGELTVLDWNVAYEVGEPAPAPIPPGELCSPTRPQGIPGEEDDCCYCPCCGHVEALADTHSTRTPSGRPALSGRCTSCGCRVMRTGGSTSSRPIPAPQPSPVPGPVGTLPGAVIAGVAVRPSLTVHRVVPEFTARRTLSLAMAPPPRVSLAVSMPPITAVKGIKKAFAEKLAAINIDSLDRLAAAQPEVVAEIRGVSLNMATRWIEDARRLRALTIRGGTGPNR